ncbi:MAG: hypothetical protein WCP28_17980 [Actinomycetes bacterium]
MTATAELTAAPPALAAQCARQDAADFQTVHVPPPARTGRRATGEWGSATLPGQRTRSTLVAHLQRLGYCDDTLLSAGLARRTTSGRLVDAGSADF